MTKKVRVLILIIASGLFLLDRILKWLSLQDDTPHLLNKFLGWQPFLNTGIAFSIPVPNIVTVLLSIIILSLVFYLIIAGANRSTFNFFALILIFVGALSNLIDRIWISNTIDYFLIFTSLFNLADVFIVSGFVLYLFQTLKKAA